VKRAVTAAILIPLVILALFKAPLWLFVLLVFGVAVLAAHEYFGIVTAQGFRPFEIACYILLALSIVASYAMSSWFFGQPGAPSTLATRISASVVFWYGLPIIAFLGPLFLLVLALRREPLSESLPDAAASYMMLPYVGFTLGILPMLRAANNGALYLLYLMLLVWCGDIAAYYVGRAIGKHKLAPRISPGKSWEGAIASVLAAILVSSALFHFLPNIQHAFYYFHLLMPPGGWTTKLVTELPARPATAPFWLAALFAIVVNVAAQLGDLVESALKRGAGVKDSGKLLPGHGGVLDRIDALLFALPVGIIFYLAGLGRYFIVS
jgi:phosphatidate cytidylyltransferase